MKVQEKNKLLQESFFEQIKNSIPNNYTLVDFVADKLNVSQDSAYRRIRGDKLLDLEETALLCQLCNVSFDSSININTNSIIFKYNQLNMEEYDVYLNYIKNMSQGIGRLLRSSDKKIYFTAVDIPIFHFLKFKELTSFKLFAWSNSSSGVRKNFSSFVEYVDNHALLPYYNEILVNYTNVPSVEIWTYNTIDNILRLINFYYETGYFENSKIPLLLCDQLIELIKNLESWAENQSKNSVNASSTFNLYVSEIDLDNSFMLMECDGVKSCMLKLFTINSITSFNENFCEETKKWIDTTITRSIPISGASEKEKFRFFQNMKQKVYALIDKISHTSIY